MRTRLGAAVMLVALVALGACASTTSQPQVEGPTPQARPPARVARSFDESEARWRKELEAERARDDDDFAVLRDDPLPDEDGGSSFDEPEAQDGPPPPKTFWGRVKSGADTFGKATMVVMGVFVSVAMMVAPYLLLL